MKNQEISIIKKTETRIALRSVPTTSNAIISNKQQQKINHMKTIDTYNLRTPLFRLTLILALMTGFILQSIAQIVITNPASPWTVPALVTSIKVEVWGGGGGGGGALAYLGGTGAAGGGGGGSFKTSVLTVSSGQSYSITIGSAGTAGNATAGTGGTGGTTTVTGTAGTVSATGGVGGAGVTNANGAGGAGGTGGTFNGGAGGTSTGNGAGGGGGAGNNGAGSAGGNAITGAGGAGSPNIAPYIGGNGGAFRTDNGAGNQGIAPGGGGGGGWASSSTLASNAGAAGGAGQVVITYTPCTPPSITTQPANQIVNLGGSATFSVTAAGNGLTYQWHKGTNNITGATNASYTINPVASGDAATNYNVVITGTCGTVPSANATLTINALPSASVTGQTNLTCFGVHDGTITILASGGSGTGYTFSVDNGLTYVGSGNPYTYTGLSANTLYKVRVKDSVGSQSPAIP